MISTGASSHISFLFVKRGGQQRNEINESQYTDQGLHLAATRATAAAAAATVAAAAVTAAAAAATAAAPAATAAAPTAATYDLLLASHATPAAAFGTRLLYQTLAPAGWS